MIDLRAGQVFSCGPFVTTAHPTFDWETYSEAGYVWNEGERKWGSLPGLSDQNRGLGAVGVRNYVQHPSFQILSLAYDLLDGNGLRHWTPRDLDRNGVPLEMPMDLIHHVAAGGIVEAWNVGFEFQVWNYYCVPMWGWPELRMEQCRCTMAKSRAFAYPGKMAYAGTVLFPGKDQAHLRKDPVGESLVKKLTVPRKPTKANQDLRWTPFTAGEDFRKFYEYNKQDVVAEIHAGLRLPDLSPHEHQVWLFDLRNNLRGMQVDRVAIENLLAIVEQAFAKYHAELRALTNGAAETSSEVAAMLRWMAAQGIHLNNLDEETVLEALKRKDYPPAVQRVLHIRQTLAFSSVKKLYAARAQSTPQGRLHDQYVYYGAHTALWNGQGVQPANLYKGRFSKPSQVEKCLQVMAVRNLDLVEYEYGPHGSWVEENPKDHAPMEALEVVASCLRSIIVAKPGHRLMSADFSSIQAVATSALAGEEWRLEVFRTHGKIYEAMAGKLTGNTLQFYLDYKKEHGKHHDHRQNPGKLAVLSGDFGAWINGWKRFGADKLLGSDENIKRAILKTREAQPMVVEFWGGQTRNKFDKGGVEHAQLYGLEGAAISAVLNPGEAFGYRSVVYQMFEDVLYCCAPSGGFIRYHHPRLERASARGNYTPAPWELSLSYQGWNSNQQKGPPGWITMDLYGGVLTQNIVSHVCRELQALALLRLEAAGYPVVMHTHDENVVEIPDGWGSLQEYIALVRGPLPAWARTPDGQPWPIKVPDAWEATRYGKWED